MALVYQPDSNKKFDIYTKKITEILKNSQNIL